MRDSAISQYPSFPDSASLFAGSHASMQFDEFSMQPHQEGESSEAQFSVSTVRDGQQYAGQMKHSSSQHQQQQQSVPGRRRMQNEEMEIAHSQDRIDYARQALMQQHQLPQTMLDYDHGNLMYRHGRPSNQSMPHSLPESSTSGDLEDRSGDGSHSNETIATKERERRKSKGWGLNISSVLGGAAAGAGSGPNGNYGRQQVQHDPMPFDPNSAEGGHKMVSTPAQQLAAEHSDKLFPQQANSSIGSTSAPLDSKKAKKVAEKAAREAEKKKRAAQEKAARERARAVMQKRNQILASSNSRDQVEWLTLADNDMTKALQPPISTAAPLMNQSETARGKQASVSQSSNSDPSAFPGTSLYTASALASPYSGHLGQSSSPAWQGQRSSSRGKVRRREYDDEGAGIGGSSGVAYGAGNFHSSSQDIYRQSMQSFHTGDSDPGPGGPYLASLPGMQRQGSASSLNSAPGLIDGASSRTRLGERNSFDTRSVASSLDNQLIQNMENMTAAEGNRHRSGSRTGSTSPGPVHLVGQRPSMSRQSHGSRTSSAHRQGSASPLHHQTAPRFHPYSVNASGGGASNSTGNVALPSSAHSSYSFNLPSLASISQSNPASDYVESLQSGSGASTVARPRSMTRRLSQSIHRGPASRGSVASGDGPKQRGQQMGSINPMFHVANSHAKASQQLNGSASPQQHTLPPFSHLAAAASANAAADEEYFTGRSPARNRSHSASQR